MPHLYPNQLPRHMRFVLTLLLSSSFLCFAPGPFTHTVQAQGFSGGFRAGLNFITFSGDKESFEDMEVETMNRTTGFHVGATFAYAFTDLIGVKADLMYSQKGVETVFEDIPSVIYFYSGMEDTDGAPLRGQRTSEVDVVNSYIDIPLTAYYRFGGLEVEGGFSAGLLIGSRASGGISYSGLASPNGVTSLNVSVDANYLSDEAGFRSIGLIGESGLAINEPSVIGAYYNHDSSENVYRRLDFGLVGGLAYYLNNGLYLGVRYQYGLTDVTKGENDLRVVSDTPSSLERAFNEDDKDYARSFQASVGFRF